MQILVQGDAPDVVGQRQQLMELSNDNDPALGILQFRANLGFAKPGLIPQKAGNMVEAFADAAVGTADWPPRAWNCRMPRPCPRTSGLKKRRTTAECRGSRDRWREGNRLEPFSGVFSRLVYRFPGLRLFPPSRRCSRKRPRTLPSAVTMPFGDP